MQQKNILKVVDAALLLDLPPREIIKLFDDGQLRGFRQPGAATAGGGRRIYRHALVEFAKKNKRPLNDLEGDQQLQ